MASLKARLLGGWLGDRVLRDAHVTEVEDLGPKFRRMTLAGEGLRGVASAAGDKLQVYLPEVGARTYTPFAVDAGRGQLDLLAYLHGDGPGASWARSLGVGTPVRFLGPRDSLPLDSRKGPVALFGDETSFGVARSLLDFHPAASAAPTFVFEVASRADYDPVIHALSLPSEALAERAGAGTDAFYAECATRLVRALPSGGTVFLTGNARSIQQVRSQLRGRAGPINQKVKAYWSPGKRGLD